MSRVRRGFKARQRRNKILKLAKGYQFDRRTKFWHASETVRRALHYSYISRRLLKRDMRKLWVIRIGAAAKQLGTSYSRFMGLLKSKNVKLNRKMLADIAARDPKGFGIIYNSVK